MYSSECYMLTIPKKTTYDYALADNNQKGIDPNSKRKY